MKRSVIMGLAIALLSGLSVWIVFSQTGEKETASDAGQVRGGNASSAAPGAMRKQLTQFREEHKSTFQLTGLVDKIARLDQHGAQPLTAAQAQQMLAILTPLRAQEKLTQGAAKETIDALQQVLTSAQRTEISEMPEARHGGGQGRPNGGGGGAGNGAGGQGGADRRASGERPRWDRDAMQNFNPFHSSAGGPGAGRMETFFAQLQTKAQ